jgi:hypothetical protein
MRTAVERTVGQIADPCRLLGRGETDEWTVADTTILSSGCTSTAVPTSLSVPTGVITMPSPPPNVVSIVPSASKRMTTHVLGAAEIDDPTATSFPSACRATPLNRTSLRSVMTMPPDANAGSSAAVAGSRAMTP